MRDRVEPAGSLWGGVNRGREEVVAIFNLPMDDDALDTFGTLWIVGSILPSMHDPILNSFI